jgi:hypothetical protein
MSGLTPSCEDGAASGSRAVSSEVMAPEPQALRHVVPPRLPPTRAVPRTEMTVAPTSVPLPLTTTVAAARRPWYPVRSSSVHRCSSRHLPDLAPTNPSAHVFARRTDILIGHGLATRRPGAARHRGAAA